MHDVLFQMSSPDVSVENIFFAPLQQTSKALVQSFWLHNHLDNFRYVNSKSSLEEKTTVCVSVTPSTSPSKKPQHFSEMAILRWIGKGSFGFHVILQVFLEESRMI